MKTTPAKIPAPAPLVGARARNLPALPAGFVLRGEYLYDPDGYARHVLDSAGRVDRERVSVILGNYGEETHARAWLQGEADAELRPMNSAGRPALLAVTDPRYLRRLVRECNALPDGFYAGGQRYTRARYRAGRLEGRRLASYLDPHDPRNGRPVWMAVEPSALGDAYGRTVCASRRVKGGAA